MNSFMQYQEAFLSGFYFSLSDDRLSNDAPVVDFNSIKSIGYNDGYRHGISRLSVGKKNLVTSLLEEYINKSYITAVKLQKSYQGNYDLYKNGFMVGFNEVKEKIALSDKTLSIIPNLDDSDIYAIGYYDGYCNSLNKFNNKEEVDVESLTRESFNSSFSKYSVFTNCENKKMG